MNNCKLPEGYNYRPMKDFLELRDSDIEGHGVFATEDIKTNKVLGQSHFLVVGVKDLLRSPMASYTNCSEEPNCEVYIKEVLKIKGTKYLTQYNMRTIRPIFAGEELTLDYFKSLCGTMNQCDR